MQVIEISSSELCILNYGYGDRGEIYSGSDAIMQFDDLLDDINKNPSKIFSFAWTESRPSEKIINDDLVSFLEHDNVQTAPKYLSKLTYENILKISKKRPRFVIEEFGNIFGNLNEMDSNEAANAVKLIKNNIKNYSIDNIKPYNKKKIEVEVNGVKKVGYLEYGKANDNAISINLDIRLVLEEGNKKYGNKFNVNGRVQELLEIDSIVPIAFGRARFFLIEEFSTPSRELFFEDILNVLRKNSKNDYFHIRLLDYKEVIANKQIVSNFSVSNEDLYVCDDKNTLGGIGLCRLTDGSLTAYDEHRNTSGSTASSEIVHLVRLIEINEDKFEELKDDELIQINF